MKNKGFTLVELLAVIIILGLISLVAVPAVSHLLKENKENAYESKKDMLLSQAKMYTKENRNYLYDSDKTYNGYVCNNITVQELINTGYINESKLKDGKVTDPRDNTSMNNLNIIIYIKSEKPSNAEEKYIGNFITVLSSRSNCR